MAAWVQALGALTAIVAAVGMWVYERWRDRRERDSRALSFAISLVPVLERAQYRVSAEFDPQAAWELFNEHTEDASEAYRILPGLPGLLSDAHLLPPDKARAVQTVWAKAQEHDARVDKIKRADAGQRNGYNQLRNELKANWPALAESLHSALETLRAYVAKPTV